MKNRSLHELYLILWEEIKDKVFIEGLCFEINDLYFCEGGEKINVSEHYIIRQHFHPQRPSSDLHPEFYYPECTSFWFPTGATDVRKAFIQKLIETTKSLS